MGNGKETQHRRIAKFRKRQEGGGRRLIVSRERLFQGLYVQEQTKEIENNSGGEMREKDREMKNGN